MLALLCASAFFAAGVVPTALGQTVHVVSVGVEGSFFVPGVISALQNDIVTFVFGGDMHDVTQAAFDNPCQPLPGGFSSGLAGIGTNSTAPVPSWDLHIQNASEPIWFYCGASRPISHCSTGMVGVINPPSIDMYDQWINAAKAISPTISVPSPPLVLTGQGAFATNSPMPTPTSSPVPFVPTSSPTSTTISAPTSTSVSTVPSPTTSPSTKSSGSKMSEAAIIGASVGGGVGLIIIAVLSLCLCRARHRSSKSKPVSPFYSTAHSDALINHSVSQKLQSPPSNPSLTASTHHVSISTMPSSPLVSAQTSVSPIIEENPPLPEPVGRRVRPLPQPRPIIRRPSNISRIEEDAGPVNINVLAREVAALLQPPTPGARFQSGDESDGRRPKQTVYHEENRTRDSTPAPPPHYRSG